MYDCLKTIPSLLVTLLHEKNCTISSGNREQEIRWRKVQGDSSTRTGLHLVSQPFKATYIDDNGSSNHIQIEATRASKNTVFDSLLRSK